MGKVNKNDLRSWRWFYQQLPELTAKGILSEDNAAALKAYYGEPAKKPDIANVMMVAFGIIGALLIGGGIIMILAHNWDDLPHQARIAMAFAPLVIAQVAGMYTLLFRRDSNVWSEGSAVFISIGVCAVISIVAQIYHISGDTAAFIMTWALLTLPLVYLFQSSAAAILYLALAVAWGYAAKHQKLDLWVFWLLFSAILPHIWYVLKTDRRSLRANWLLWGALFALTCMTGGIAGEYQISRLGIMAYGLLFCVSYLTGRLYFNEEVSLWRKPPLYIGMLGLIITSIVCSFGAFWRFTSPWYQTGNQFPVWYPDVIVAGLAITAYVVFQFRILKNKDYQALIPGGMIILAIACWIIHVFDCKHEFPALLFNLYLLLLGSSMIAAGMREKLLSKLNGGLLIIGGTIILRFFDADFSLITRGIAFIVIGIAFMLVNHKVRNKWRQENLSKEVAHE